MLKYDLDPNLPMTTDACRAVLLAAKEAYWGSMSSTDRAAREAIWRDVQDLDYQLRLLIARDENRPYVSPYAC